MEAALLYRALTDATPRAHPLTLHAPRYDAHARLDGARPESAQRHAATVATWRYAGADVAAVLALAVAETDRDPADP